MYPPKRLITHIGSRPGPFCPSDWGPGALRCGPGFPVRVFLLPSGPSPSLLPRAASTSKHGTPPHARPRAPARAFRRVKPWQDW